MSNLGMMANKTRILRFNLLSFWNTRLVINKSPVFLTVNSPHRWQMRTQQAPGHSNVKSPPPPPPLTPSPLHSQTDSLIGSRFVSRGWPGLRSSYSVLFRARNHFDSRSDYFQKALISAGRPERHDIMDL